VWHNWSNQLAIAYTTCYGVIPASTYCNGLLRGCCNTSRLIGGEPFLVCPLLKKAFVLCMKCHRPPWPLWKLCRKKHFQILRVSPNHLGFDAPINLLTDDTLKNFPRLRELQSCQFGFFEAKFVIFGLFSTPLALFVFEKRPNEIWLFLAFFGELDFLCRFGRF